MGWTQVVIAEQAAIARPPAQVSTAVNKSGASMDELICHPLNMGCKSDTHKSEMGQLIFQ